MGKREAMSSDTFFEIVPTIAKIDDFDVRRFLPSSRQRSVGPFIFFDEMGPLDFAAGHGLDIAPHPHIGLATLSWLVEGEVLHRDSLGMVQVIRPGEVNLMTAGLGVVHSEQSTAAVRAHGGRLHALQIWIALPEEQQEMVPEFQHFTADQIPSVTQQGVSLSLVAGQGWGLQSPVTVHLPILFADIRLGPGRRFVIPSLPPERAIHILSGDLELGGEIVSAGRFLVLESGTEVNLYARTAVHLVLIGGETLQSRRHMWWNFVALDRDRIEKAKQDWQSGRFPGIPKDLVADVADR